MIGMLRRASDSVEGLRRLRRQSRLSVDRGGIDLCFRRIEEENVGIE